jgi:hypothetical protein
MNHASTVCIAAQLDLTSRDTFCPVTDQLKITGKANERLIGINLGSEI